MLESIPWKNALELIEIMKQVGKALVEAQPQEMAVGNIIRRILHIIRQQHAKVLHENESTSSTSLLGTSSKMKVQNNSLEDSLSDLPNHEDNDTTQNQRQKYGKSISEINIIEDISDQKYPKLTKINSVLQRNSDGLLSNKLNQSNQTSMSMHAASHSYSALSSLGSTNSLQTLGLVPSMLNPNVGLKKQKSFLSTPLADTSKNKVLNGIKEMIGDLEEELHELHKDINALATEHIHNNEIILTFGRSQTIEKFLITAHDKNVNFDVVITEGPSLWGYDLAEQLSNAGMTGISVICDSGIYAVMSRVNQVFLPCKAVIANGGLIAPAGAYMVALAAKEHSVPVICVTGLYKLSPIYYREQDDIFSDLRNPNALMTYEEANEMREVELLSPAYDYIPPDLVDLYITNVGGGGHQPSYVYRLLDEFYSREDWKL